MNRPDPPTASCERPSWRSPPTCRAGTREALVLTSACSIRAQRTIPRTSRRSRSCRKRLWQALQQPKPTSTSRERSSRNLSWPRKGRVGTQLVLGEHARDFADSSISAWGGAILLSVPTSSGPRGGRGCLHRGPLPQLLLLVFASEKRSENHPRQPKIRLCNVDCLQ